jgi:hypothetical protein
MAISPKSKGLGNIGSIVNRQGMASPTKPMAKPAPKPVAKMPVPKPVAPANRATTTLAQRQAAPSPFRSATKPAQPKINPLAQQQPNPLQQAMSPQPRPDLPPGAQMRKPMLGATQPTTPPPQPFNPNPFNKKPGLDPNILNPDQSLKTGQGPIPDPTVSNQMIPPGYQYNGPDPMDPGQSPMGEPTLPYMSGQQPAYIGQGGTQEQWNQFNQGSGGGIGMSYVDPYGPGGMTPGMFGNGYQVGGDINIDPFTGQPTPEQPDSMNMTAPYMGDMFKNYNGPIIDAGTAGDNWIRSEQQQNSFDPNFANRVFGLVGQQGSNPNFGNPNPMTSDYDQLEGSAFNTNPSSGSMFGGGGFAGK